MRFRSTIIYLLAAVLLLSLYLYETRKENKEQSAKEEAKLLFRFKPDQLESLALRREKDFVQLERRNTHSLGVWKVVAPVSTSADSFALSALTRSLTELKYERLISDSAKDLAEFGLDKPSLAIAYKAGAEEGNVSFGSQSPIGDGVYATLADKKKVYLLAGLAKQQLDKSLYDVRDKKLLTLETEKVSRVIVERMSGTWHLYKRDGRWFLEGDEELKIDGGKIEVFVRPIVWADALSYEKEEANDLQPYGLHRPSARVVLSDESKTEEILFGESAKENSVYAMVKGKPQIVTVRKRLLEDLPSEKQQIREKDPAQSKAEGSS